MVKQADVKKLHIAGDATRQEYTLYIIVAWPMSGGDPLFYAGKTGDNRKGCNPIISRAGNHFSLNKKHSQMRNLLSKQPHYQDFDVFYSHFGKYIPPEEKRAGINKINRLERRLRHLCGKRFGDSLLNGPGPQTGLKKLKNSEERRVMSLINEVGLYIRRTISRRQRKG